MGKSRANSPCRFSSCVICCFVLNTHTPHVDMIFKLYTKECTSAAIKSYLLVMSIFFPLHIPIDLFIVASDRHLYQQTELMLHFSSVLLFCLRRQKAIDIDIQRRFGLINNMKGQKECQKIIFFVNGCGRLGRGLEIRNGV